jgi:hypothetical protein
MNPADADTIMLRTLNTSLNPPIGLDALVGCLEGRAPVLPWREHLAVLAGEVPRDMVFRFIARHRLDPARILAALCALAHEDRNADFEAWLGELAHPAA